jgi:hypothetical protein
MNGHVPGFLGQGTEFRFVYPSRKDAGLFYWLETSTNLVDGIWTNAGYAELPDTGVCDADFDAVTNEVSTDESQTFIRLRVKEL